MMRRFAVCALLIGLIFVMAVPAEARGRRRRGYGYGSVKSLPVLNPAQAQALGLQRMQQNMARGQSRITTPRSYGTRKPTTRPTTNTKGA